MGWTEMAHLKTSVHLKEEELLRVVIHQELHSAYQTSGKILHTAMIHTS